MNFRIFAKKQPFTKMDNILNTAAGAYVLRALGASKEDALCVSQRYYATLDNIQSALESGAGVIVEVDGGELWDNEIFETVEDRFQGEKADLFLVVLGLDSGVVVCNPEKGEEPLSVPRDRFIDSWRDSRFHLVSINFLNRAAASYVPSPIALGDVTLPEGLEELTETIAENTHDVWASRRMAEGWTFGPERDDTALHHPCLLPYSALSDAEKDYDRATALSAIKLILKLGYNISKR